MMVQKKLLSVVLSLFLIMSLIPMGVASAATLLSDDFESATSFPSTGWTNNTGNGTWSIATDGSKVAKQTSASSGTYIATNNVTVGSTFTYSAKVKTGATNVRNGLVARYTNGNNYYWLVLYNGNIVLNKKVSGSTTTIQQVAFTANTSTFYELKLEVDGTSVKGYVDGVLKVQGTDSSLTSGQVGFYANGVASYDDVLVTDGAGGGGGDTTAPTAPTGLAATAASSSQIDLSWTASTDNVGVTGYDVYRGGSFVKTVTGTSTSDTGLTASTTYSYTVKAKDAAGNASANSNTASATTQAGADTQAPTAPTGLTATAASSSQINLSWTASTDNVGVTGYDVYRGGSFVKTVTGTSTSDTGLTASTTYSYTVKAKDAAGNASADSNTASATTQAGGGTDAKFSVPGTSVTASTNDGNVPANTVDGSLTTRWSGQGDGAWIQYDLGSNKKVAYIKAAFYNGSTRTSTFDIQTSTNGTTWNTVSAGVTSALNNNLQTFDFTDVDPARYVRLIGHGNSVNDWNSYTEVEIYGTDSAGGGGGDTTAPTAPTGLTATATSSSQINLSWTASTDNVGVTGYDVYRGGTFLKSVTGTSTSDTGLTASTAYSYTVKAKDAAGNASANSNTASATTQAGGGGGLCTTCAPSANFDLTKWKITLPDASEVANLSNYEHPDWFFTDSATGGMVFLSPNIGETTTNSTYTRSELREMINASAGTKELGNNWVTSTSSSTTKAQAGGVDGTMNATLRVDRVSTTGDAAQVGRVVVGQIHGPDTEVIRLYYHKRPSDAKGAIYFGTDDLSNNNTYVNIIGGPSSLNPSNGISLGQNWSYEIKVVGLLMTVKVTPEGGSTTTVNYTIPSGYNDKFLYYKAGVYNQNKTGETSDHVKATFFSLTHVHP